MKISLPFGLLPHEGFFGGFLILTWLRLVVAVGPWDRDAFLYFGLLTVNLGLIAGCRARPTRMNWHLRLWYYPLVMNIVFPTMGSTAMKVSSHTFDPLLEHLDVALVGVTPSLRAQALVRPWLTEILSFCYLLFFPYLAFSVVQNARRGLPHFRGFIVGLFTIYAFGFLGYSWVPAAGPHLAMAERFTTPLTGWALTSLNARVVAEGSNGVDVFPSLHVAVSGFLLGFDWRHARWRHRLYVVPCVGLWFSTVYLRYHYLVDLLCGFALAAFALWVAQRWARTQPEPNPSQP